MPDPTAPQIPNDAPQDVKDFFDCRGNRLVWRSGEVTWLGLKVTPTVDFTQDHATGGLAIRVSILGGMVGFDLPASVNAAGELVVDTSSVPDLSEWGIGGRADIDAAIKRINDWFKKNGKKLKPATFANGAVTLEKIAIAPGAAATVPVVPVAPVTPPATKPKAVAPPPPPSSESSGSGCSLPFLMMLILFGVIVIGGGIGFVYFGGPGPAAQATATTSAAPTAAASPTASPTASLTASATATASPSSSPVATVTASPLPIGEFTAVCIRVVHDQIGEFISYLDWFVYWSGADVEYFEVTVIGANNGQPQTLEFESRSQAYEGVLGLHEAGDKRIVSVIAHMSDGSEIDLTDDLIDSFGSDEFSVRYPQEDSLGFCPA